MNQYLAFVNTALVGVAACIRAEAPLEQLHATSRMVAGILDSHRPAGSG